MAHIPVLEEAAVDALNVRDDGTYIDATFGRGGHSRRILERLGPSGRLIALDVDPDAIGHGRRRFGDEPRLTLLRRNFRELGAVVREYAPGAGVDGILMDLGVSSPQLDDSERGFSFRGDGPLDMRMNPESGRPAADWLADVDESELIRVLREYGEERHARRIAHAIIVARSQTPLRKTSQLAALIESAVPGAARRADRIHPATRSFQAIRIAVNDELGALEQALSDAIDALAPGGRLVVISFHSLEDRRVKHAIRAAEQPPPANRRAPAPVAFTPKLRSVGRLVRPADSEAESNPRARSARMRTAERLPAADRPGAPA